MTAEHNERTIELFRRMLADWPTTDKARQQFERMSESEQVEAIDHLADWVKLQPSGNISVSLWKYLRDRLWRKRESESSVGVLKAAAKFAGANLDYANPVIRLPNGDQIANGEYPTIWIKRSDTRWAEASERYRKEKRKTPMPHGSAYFDGYGYAFPQSYFAIVPSGASEPPG
jgi:hypothetical protein